MSRYAYVLFPLAAGAMLAAQAPINARLRVILGSAIGSALVSFAVGLLLLAGALAIAGEAGSVANVGGSPWWAYLGGLCGAVFVIAILVAAPQISVTTTFVSAVAGQVLFAALIDRFGWFGAAQVDLPWERIAALCLLGLSLVLLVRST